MDDDAYLHFRDALVAEMRRGDMSCGGERPTGDSYHYIRDKFGNCDAFVISDEWIWYCHQDGSNDGDEMRWAVPYSDELAERILTLESLLGVDDDCAK